MVESGSVLTLVIKRQRKLQALRKEAGLETDSDDDDEEYIAIPIRKSKSLIRRSRNIMWATQKSSGLRRVCAGRRARRGVARGGIS